MGQTEKYFQLKREEKLRHFGLTFGTFKCNFFPSHDQLLLWNQVIIGHGRQCEIGNRHTVGKGGSRKFHFNE